MKVINTTKAPAAIGPYSQAIAANGLLFTSGQIPVDPTTGLVVEGGIESQARMVMENLKAVLLEADVDFSAVVKTTCFISSIDDFAAFNSVYSQYFTSDAKPARSCVAVKTLPKGALVEVEVVAEKE